MDILVEMLIVSQWNFGVHCDGFGSHPSGGIEICLEASCYRRVERVGTKDLTLPKFFFWQVIDDDDIVPGWEGKIVAWVEDDSGQKVLSYQEQMAWHRDCHREN